MKAVSFLVLLAISQSALCCLNDRDTLENESRKSPEAFAALIGDFPIYPPLYYKMRIERILPLLKVDRIDALNLYDDVAVAYDRIGDDDAALTWIERKGKLLERLDTKHAYARDRYTYLANLGTFHAHRWAKTRNLEQPEEIEEAQDLIRKAISENPGAHFGREAAQLGVLDWLAEGDQTRSPWERVRNEVRWAAGLPGGHAVRDPGSSLAGLVIYGGAWKSPDLIWALGRSSFRPLAIEALAAVRAEELIRDGTKPFNPSLEKDVEEYLQRPDDVTQWEIGEAHRLRKIAEAQRSELTGFMMKKLLAGKHPDTDLDFWSGWIQPAPLQPDSPPIPIQVKRFFASTAGILLIMPGLPIGLAVALYVWSGVRKRRSGRNPHLFE